LTLLSILTILRLFGYIYKTGMLQAMTNDPKDRHVLAAAFTAQTDVIVTNNIKDFRENDLAPWNIKAQSPDEFLSDLFDDYPDSILE
jgi:predicted nucleic acid-binding protein